MSSSERIETSSPCTDYYADDANLRSGNSFSSRFLLIFPFAVLVKFAQYIFLPPKYFYDSNHILGIMKSVPDFILGPYSYNNTAVFSNAINVLGLSTLQQWSIFYAVIFNIVLFNIAKKYKIKTFSSWLWFLGTCGMLNLYVFNLSKDIFQFFVFFIVYLVVESKRSALSKIIISTGILFCWGLIFRIYYCLIAVYIIMTYVMLQSFFKPKRLFSIITLIFSALLISFALTRYIMLENYEAMLMARNEINFFREDSPDAETMIVDIIRNDGNPLIFLVNIFLNTVRLMLPVELLLLIDFRIRYLIFIGYQLITTSNYLKIALSVLHKETNNAQKVAFCVFTGFMLVSAIFEGDFGSWVRHESAILLIMLLMFFKQTNKQTNKPIC
jgi:hypothetical protein